MILSLVLVLFENFALWLVQAQAAFSQFVQMLSNRKQGRAMYSHAHAMHVF